VRLGEYVPAMASVGALHKVRVLFVCLALVAACSSKSEEGSMVAPSTVAGNSSGGASAEMSGASTAHPYGGAVSLTIVDSQAGTGATSTSTLPDGEVCGVTCPQGQPACAVETCDGVDNNCDGIIDNVDKNQDGICDCVLIATLGVKGNAGAGDVFSTWLSARSNNGATSLGDQTLTPALLAMYEVIVAEDVHNNHAYSPAEVAALQAWVSNGGGLMTLTGYSLDTTEVVNVNTLLQPFGISYGDMHILPRRGGVTVQISQWVPHPVDLGVTAVGVDNGYQVQGPGVMFATSGAYNVGEALEVAKGHVLTWGDEWITYNSEWTQHPDYQVQLFWLNAIKWLTVASTCQIPIPANLGGPK
jgi:hypothetical protein